MLISIFYESGIVEDVLVGNDFEILVLGVFFVVNDFVLFLKFSDFGVLFGFFEELVGLVVENVECFFFFGDLLRDVELINESLD